jgi:hypothetical protein
MSKRLKELHDEITHRLQGGGIPRREAELL